MAAFEHTDAAFTSRPPTLAGAEPPLFFQLSPFFAVCATVRNGYPRHSHFLNLLFIFSGVEARVGSHQVRQASETPLMFLPQPAPKVPDRWDAR